MKKALITGITGQDGSYLAELLLEKGYEVHGMKRRASSYNTQRIDHLYQDIHENSNFRLHYGDLSDSSNLIRLVHDIEPDEIYNLAAQSHVKVSWDCPEYTADCDALGTLRLLVTDTTNSEIYTLCIQDANAQRSAKASQRATLKGQLKQAKEQRSKAS